MIGVLAVGAVVRQGRNPRRRLGVILLPVLLVQVGYLQNPTAVMSAFMRLADRHAIILMPRLPFGSS